MLLCLNIKSGLLRYRSQRRRVVTVAGATAALTTFSYAVVWSLRVAIVTKQSRGRNSIFDVVLFYIAYLIGYLIHRFRNPSKKFVRRLYLNRLCRKHLDKYPTSYLGGKPLKCYLKNYLSRLLICSFFVISRSVSE